MTPTSFVGRMGQAVCIRKFADDGEPPRLGRQRATRMFLFFLMYLGVMLLSSFQATAPGDVEARLAAEAKKHEYSETRVTETGTSIRSELRKGVACLRPCLACTSARMHRTLPRFDHAGRGEVLVSSWSSDCPAGGVFTSP